MTLGEHGSVLSTAAGEVVRFSAMSQSQVVDTTGAGDVFVGYLAAQLCKGNDLLDAIQVATVAASISVVSVGAQASIPHAEEVAAALQRMTADQAQPVAKLPSPHARSRSATP